MKILPLTLLLACTASAATLQIMNLDDMTAQSSAVVHAHVVGSRVDWNDARHNMAVTIYTFKADRYLKGNLGGTFEITELGGQIGKHTTMAPGVPVFTVGDEMVLFVWTDTTHARHEAMGYDQGAFRIVRDRATGARVLNHAQPLSGGGQFVESDALFSAVRNSGLPLTSRDINQFLGQLNDSVRRVAARTQAVR